MKHDCDIVRDLMPMCIDGTASEKARKMVNEHVAECPPCDKVYAEMRGEAQIELPVQQASPEFVTTVKKMKSRRKRRTWLTLLTGVVIAAVVAFGAFRGYYWYFEEPHRIEEAQLNLVASKDGIALIHAANIPKRATMYIQFSEMNYPESAEGFYEGYVYLSATRHEARTDADDVYFVVGNVADGKVVANDTWGDDVPVYRLLLGRGDGSGQVFYLADEDQLQQVSIKGAHLKSPENMNVINGSQAYYDLHPFLTATPMPYATYTPRPDGSQAFVMASPTPTPRATLEPGESPAQPTSIPQP